MKKLLHRVVAAVLCFVLCTSLMLFPTHAADPSDTARDTTFETMLADDLKALGLFQGVSDTDYGLNRVPSRAEAVTMLVRLLGKEKEAASGNFQHPFRDVPRWADKYVGYAYQNGLTHGVSEASFDGDAPVSVNMYLALMLRALGYSEDKGDFVWESPYGLAERCGILPKQVQREGIRRADIVTISYASLLAKMKHGRQTLGETLWSQGVYDPMKYEACIKKLVFREWSELTRDNQAEAIAAITGREGFVVKKTLSEPPWDAQVILGERNGNPELYLVFRNLKGTGRAKPTVSGGDGIVMRLPLPMETKSRTAIPDELEVTHGPAATSKGKYDAIRYSVTFDSKLILDEGKESEQLIHRKGTYEYFVDLNTAEVTLSIDPIADSTDLVMTLIADSDEALINGKAVTLAAKPFVRDNIFFLPLKDVAVAMGGTYTFDGEIAKTVLSGITTEYKLGSHEMEVDGVPYIISGMRESFSAHMEAVPIDAQFTPQMIDNVVYIPTGFHAAEAPVNALQLSREYPAHNMVILGSIANDLGVTKVKINDVYENLPKSLKSTLNDGGVVSEVIGYRVEKHYNEGIEIYVMRASNPVKDLERMDGKVCGIRVKSTDYSTPRGLRVGDDESRPMLLYGEQFGGAPQSEFISVEKSGGKITAIVFKTRYFTP